MPSSFQRVIIPMLHLVTRKPSFNSVLDTLVNPILAKIAGSLNLESVHHCLGALITSRSIADPSYSSSRVSQACSGTVLKIELSLRSACQDYDYHKVIVPRRKERGQLQFDCTVPHAVGRVSVTHFRDKQLVCNDARKWTWLPCVFCE